MIVRQFLFISILFLLISSTYAQKAVKIKVTKDHYDFSRKEFLEKYGTDDTSRALINYFFNKREGSLAKISIFAVLAPIEAKMLSGIVKWDDNVGKEFILLNVGIPTLFTLILAIDGTTKLATFSRKKLYIALMEYQNGNGLSSKYKKPMLLIPKLWVR